MPEVSGFHVHFEESASMPDGFDQGGCSRTTETVLVIEANELQARQVKTGCARLTDKSSRYRLPARHLRRSSIHPLTSLSPV